MGRVISFPPDRTSRRRRSTCSGVVVDLMLLTDAVDQQVKMRRKGALLLPVANRARDHAKSLRHGFVAAQSADDIVDRADSAFVHEANNSCSVNFVKFPAHDVKITERRCIMNGMQTALKSSHAPRERRSLQAIADRLIATRTAMGLKPSEFADRADIRRNAYSQYENAKNRISLEAAYKLVDTYGLDLDWIYDGDMSRLPHDLANRIAKTLSAA